MKECARCRIEKLESEFNRDRKSGDGLQPYCRGCAKEYRQAYYVKNRERHLRVSARSKKERQIEAMKYVIEIKKGPCSDCGQRFNPWQMDFDHLHGKRKGRRNCVSAFVGGGYVMEVIKAEIAKCELVCANCHRDRTFKRGQQRHGYDTLYSM